jgi:predicted PurR-regulated permease PerM
VATLWLLIRPAAEQATQLAAEAPDRLQAFEPRLESVLGALGIAAEYDALRARLWAGALDTGRESVGQLLRATGDAGGLLADVGLVVVVSFYMLLDGPRIGPHILAYVPGQHRGTARRIECSVRRVLGGYLRGQVLLAAIVGVLAGIGCWLLGVPYALILGLLAGLLELVPMFGSVLSAVPALAVAVWQPFPTVLWVLLLFLVIQQVESNILAPRVTGDAVGLHPLAAVFAVLVGFELGGVLGGMLATPMAGIGWELVRSSGPLGMSGSRCEAISLARGQASAVGAGHKRRTLGQVTGDRTGHAARQRSPQPLGATRVDMLDAVH